jgi:hypothetical protein
MPACALHRDAPLAARTGAAWGAADSGVGTDPRSHQRPRLVECVNRPSPDTVPIEDLVGCAASLLKTIAHAAISASIPGDRLFTNPEDGPAQPGSAGTDGVTDRAVLPQTLEATAQTMIDSTREIGRRCAEIIQEIAENRLTIQSLIQVNLDIARQLAIALQALIRAYAKVDWPEFGNYFAPFEPGAVIVDMAALVSRMGSPDSPAAPPDNRPQGLWRKPASW